MNLGLPLIFQILSLLISIGAYERKRNKICLYFIPFLFLTVVVEMIGGWYLSQGIRNYAMYNVFTAFEFIFYSSLYYLHFKRTKFKMAVLVFILKNRQLERKWYVLPAAVFSIVAMASLLTVLVLTIEYLTSAGPVINAVILAIVPLVLGGGAAYAFYLRRNRPDVYARIGGQEAA